MVHDTGTCKKFVLKQRQRYIGIVPMKMEITSCPGMCTYSISASFTGRKKGA